MGAITVFVADESVFIREGVRAIGHVADVLHSHRADHAAIVTFEGDT